MAQAQHRPLAFLGGLSAQAFLRDYWQKRPLLVRGAYAPGWISSNEVFGFGAADDIEARLVSHSKKGWRVSFGPQPSLPRQKRDWTLLVQGVNLRHRAAAELLQSVDFLPHWRLDDVMLSYAVPGGGVGPHLDSYDVFLLQVEGKRRWRISQQRDVSLVPDVPLKILANFKAEEEWLLEPGDMLYLPPNVAHEGTAETACLTASLGFRAPGYGELNREFLYHMAEHQDISGRYTDRGRLPTIRPGELDDHLIEDATKRLLASRPSHKDVLEFLGCYLSAPKPTVFFDAPSEKAWQRAKPLLTRGIELDPRTILLYRGRMIFMNGEALAATGSERRLLSHLADHRRLGARELGEASPALLEQLGEWLSAGWLHVEESN